MSHTCSTCIHNGCCADLNHCGGMYYQSRFVECEECGRTFDSECEGERIDDRLLCDRCAEEAMEAEEEGEDE